MEEVEDSKSIKQRNIKYPNKQTRSNKQQLSFYTGYEKRLQEIVMKHEQNTEELKQKLQDIQERKKEFEIKVKIQTDAEDNETLNKYRKIIKEEDQEETKEEETKEEETKETLPDKLKIIFVR